MAYEYRTGFFNPIACNRRTILCTTAYKAQEEYQLNELQDNRDKEQERDNQAKSN